MPSLFADLPSPSFEQFGIWCACALIILDIALRLRSDRRESFAERNGAKAHIAPQPLIVQAAEKFATKEEVEELRARVDNIAAKISDGFDALDRKRSTSIAGLHQAIEGKTDALRREVKSDFIGVHERVNMILARVSEIAGRMSK